MLDALMKLSIGDRVQVKVDIWDDGEDHHPPGYLARAGEILVIRRFYASGKGAERRFSVSHEHITDNSFMVYATEIEPVNK